MTKRRWSVVAAGLSVACGSFAGPARAQAPEKVRSRVVVANADGSAPRVVFESPRLFEAPNWSPDGTYLLLNSGGRLWKLPAAGGEPTEVASGDVRGINNDHGISPDGKSFAISAGPVYTMPAAGGVPRRVTEKAPSYFHGWSPDGRTLAYCAQRDGNFDLYAIDVAGGDERRLTSSQGYDDGPDYSPDGRWIYFNSDRSGTWDVWRIPADGAGENDAKAERVTSDDLEDWFPHPSPDRKWLVFVSFPKGTKGHPADQPVTVRRIPLPAETLADAKPENLLSFNGGQGTLNVNSWSPDGTKFAFVRYEPTERWSHQDVGEVSVVGSARETEGVHTLTGTLDIWGKADGFHFSYKTIEGDGEIVARITEVQNTNEHAKAGVMFRTSLAADSPHATMVVTPVDGTQFLRRKEAGAVTTNTNPLRNRGILPYWVKLVRKGDAFEAFESLDGNAWTSIGTDAVPLGRRVYVGLVASSHQKEVTNTAKLDHVTLQSNATGK